jgi:hypothetical protein
MKRGAEKQLSKDDDQDDVVEVRADSSRLHRAGVPQPHNDVHRKPQLVSKWPRIQSWQNASASFRCLPFTLSTSPTDVVGYVVFQSEEAPPSRRCFHQPAVPPYVLTLPHSPPHLHQHSITSNQLLHKGSAVSQDLDQPPAPHPLSPSRHHLHLLAQL